MNKALKALLITIVAFGAIFATVQITATRTADSVVKQASVSKSLGNAELNRFIKAPTNTAVSCGTSSTLAIATSTARTYVALVNDSTSVVYLALGVPAVGSNGIRLNASGGSYEMNVGGLFTGAIYCIASSTAQMTVVEANTQ